MDVRIREATVEDAPALIEYAARLFAEDLPGIFRRPTPTLDDETSFIRQRIDPPNSTILVAEAEGRPVGLIDCVGETLAEEAHVGTFGISVDREWRGRGVGGRLIEALVDWAADAGVTRIQGYVWENNARALALYERHGFVREGVCRQAVVRDGVPIDVTLVARLLDSVSLRPMTADDRSAAVALLDEAMGRGFWGQETGLDGVAWVAVEGDTLVGVGTAHMRDDSPTEVHLPAPVCALELVAVAPASRGKGVGTRLVARLVDECTASGARSLMSYAWVHSAEGRAPLARVLEIAGFARHRRIERFYAGSVGEEPCPACGERECACAADVYTKVLDSRSESVGGAR